jgi:hypothetical protein
MPRKEHDRIVELRLRSGAAEADRLESATERRIACAEADAR